MLRHNGKLTDVPAVADELMDDGKPSRLTLFEEESDPAYFDLFEHENSGEESE